VCAVAILREIGVELDGVLAYHVEFGGEGVEVADYALEFLGEGAVFFVEPFVVVGVVGVGVAEGFDLDAVRFAGVDEALFVVILRSEAKHAAQISFEVCDTDLRTYRSS
jgi:hypothetical protein